jgi:Ni,Fe-hydrogenase III small subunit/NAD-dependent dihydropyrimidine dehydrogenase PreA subunit
MLRLLSYLFSQKLATVRDACPPLDSSARGLPALTQEPCSGNQCNACVEVCPTDAIKVLPEKNADGGAKVSLDLGCCIGCGLCFANCPTGTIAETLSTRNAVRNREDLVLTNDTTLRVTERGTKAEAKNPFHRSLHARVVSTGCSSCDMEIGASGNPVFDIDRFGVHIVASPRYADALVVTGPVGKGMQNAVKRAYEAMPEPRVVVAAGTCAISGGVHRDGYANANGLDNILPVDVYIPGCPPHPWQIIYGILLGMDRHASLAPQGNVLRTHKASQETSASTETQKP